MTASPSEPQAPLQPHESLDRIARRLADERLDRGLLAALRRFHPVSHGRHNVFETTQVLHAAGVQDTDAERFLRWSLVVHCLALVRGAHNRRDAGEALYTLGLKESRLRQLLEADAPQLMDLLPLLARRVAAAGIALDWWPLAKLALNADIDTRAADEARAWLARGFVTAEGRDVQAPA